MLDILYWNKDETLRQLIANLSMNSDIIPVLGSGFTRGCSAKNGLVPCGKDMVQYMQKCLAKYYGKNEESFSGRTFSDLCTLYNKRSSTEEKFEYFSNYFTEVVIEKEKKNFLMCFNNIFTL